MKSILGTTSCASPLLKWTQCQRSQVSFAHGHPNIKTLIKENR